MRRLGPAWAVTAAAFALVGCVSQRSADLTPVPIDRTGPAGAEIATAEVAGVRLEVAADAWPGSVLVRERSTPLEVTIDNRSGRRLSIRYEEFALVAGAGTRYAALSPFEAEPAAAAVSPLDDLHLHYRGFHPAPHLSTYYPFLTPFRSPLFYDPLYWDHYYVGGWPGLEDTVSEVRLWAVPEGVLSGEGELSGFLFFEKVPPPPDGPAEVTLRVDLVDADTGERFGTAEIPFEVDPAE